MGVGVILILFLIAFSFSAGSTEGTRFNIDDGVGAYTLISDWQITGAGEEISDAQLPYKVSGKAGETITITGMVPEDVLDDYSMMYMSNYCVSHVYIGGTEVGSYGTIKELPFGNMLGNIRVVIPLKKSYAGQTVKIEITPEYTQSMDIPVVAYGEGTGLSLYVLYHNLWRGVVCTFLLVIVILSLGAALFQIVVGVYHKNLKLYFYFGLFVACVMAWIFCSSDLPQFFTSQNEAVALTSYLSLALMGVPYMGYCSETLESGRKYFMAIQFAGCFIPIGVALCFVTGICDPPQILIITHIYMIVVVTASMIFAIKEWKINHDSRVLIVSMVLLVVSAFIGLFFYYKYPTSGLDAVAFGAGFIIFVLLLMALLIVREVRYIRERMTMDLYKEMAYSDKLTHCGNRAAMDKEIDSAVKSEKGITFVMTDLNHLKYVNDTFGHKAGDELICGGASCLEGAVKKLGLGKVFRLGGDEFAVVIWDSAVRDDFYKYLGEAISDYNKDHTYKVSMAKGCCCAEWKNEPGYFNTVYRNADADMYDDKERCHRMEWLSSTGNAENKDKE